MHSRPLAAPILVAEDDPFDVQLLGDQLVSLGLANPLLVFGNGAELLGYLDPLVSRIQRTRPPPQLLFLDLRMPAVDGFAALAAIRAEQFWSDLRIIIVSASPNPHDAERAFLLGADGFVLKPVNSIVLRAAVAPLLPPEPVIVER